MHHSKDLPGASNTALPITTSCSFNRSLWTATGNQIGREGRAYFNVGLAGTTFWTPVINIVRVSSCGGALGFWLELWRCGCGGVLPTATRLQWPACYEESPRARS